MRLVWIYHNNRFKTLLVFGTLDLIFKVIVLYVGYLPLDRFLERTGLHKGVFVVPEYVNNILGTNSHI